MAAKKLIYIAPVNVGNQRPVPRRAGLTIIGVYKLMERLNIDESRIRVSGHSGGARVACGLAYFHSDLFSGALPFCGANFHERVARVHATKNDEYGYFRVEPEVADAAKRRVRFALITGENDCRKGNVMDLFHVGFDKHGFEIKLFVAPRQGHEYRGARFFIKGLEFIEQRKMCARGDSRPTGKIANEAGAFQGGSIPGHPNLMRYLISTR